jgi:hypothetical protein
MAPFMPVDLLVVWGELSNPEVDQLISWGQSGRVGWFSQPRDGPFTVDDTISQFANIHVIPATEILETAVKGLGRDDIVLLEGVLVDIESNKGTTTTSLSRTDSGAGGCEILYVRRLVVGGVEYR